MSWRFQLILGSTLAIVRIEVTLTKAKALRRHFQQLVVFDEVDRLLEAKVGVRRQLDRTVA